MPKATKLPAENGGAEPTIQILTAHIKPSHSPLTQRKKLKDCPQLLLWNTNITQSLKTRH